jgi:hypothetical protein
MWKGKYKEKPYEAVLFSQRVLTFLDTTNSLFEQGVKRLDFGMNQWKNVDKKPSFDAPIEPYPYEYNEKNLYVNASNSLWLQNLWDVTDPSISELYFSALLERVKAFKKDNNGFDFNKGIIYANLGVAQSSQMKLDEGFANILKSLHEDSIYLPDTTTPEDNLRKSGLFTQFEDRYVKVYLERIIAQLGMPQIPSPKSFIETFMESLNNDQRVFFDYTFAKIIRSWEIWKEKEDGFTANRLLAYTQDFCLFNEDLLKDKCSKQELDSMNRPDLKKLIKKKSPHVNVEDCGADEMSNLDNKLPTELPNANQQEKCLRILLTLRNYSSHNIGGGTSNNYFYAHYEDILKELIRAMCEIALLPNPITPVTTSP